MGDLLFRPGEPFSGRGLFLRVSGYGKLPLVHAPTMEAVMDEEIAPQKVPNVLALFKKAILNATVLPEGWGAYAATLMQILDTTPPQIRTLLEILAKCPKGLAFATNEYVHLLEAFGEQAKRMPWRQTLAQLIAEGRTEEEIRRIWEQTTPRHLTGFGGQHGATVLSHVLVEKTSIPLLIIDLEKKTVTGAVTEENLKLALEIIQNKLKELQATELKRPAFR